MASADTSPLNPTARSSAASPRPTGTLAPSRQDQAAQGRLASAIVFILLTAALSALTIWLLNAGFSDDRTLSLWAKIISVRDAAESRLEYLGVVFPHLPAYLLMVLRLVPGLDHEFLGAL